MSRKTIPVSDIKPKTPSDFQAKVDAVFGERFHNTRALSQRLDAKTLVGTDADSGRPAIIRTASHQSFSASLISRFEQEAETLQRVGSQWPARVLAFGHEGDGVFLARSFVPGTPLEVRLREGPLGLLDSLHAGCCILKGLKEIHDHGVLHGAIRPNNVIIEERSGEKRTVLVNVGLLQNTIFDTSIREQRVEAAAYLSPEHAGSLDYEVSKASDLYSVGILLFECLAGRPALRERACRRYARAAPDDFDSGSAQLGV